MSDLSIEQPAARLQSGMNELTQAAFHLGVLFPANRWEPGETIEIRCLDAGKTPAGHGPRRFFSDHGTAISFAMKMRTKWDVFVGVGWRRCPVTGNMRTCRCKVKGGNDHVSRLTAAYVDLDVGKAGESLPAIVECVMAERLQPAIIVASGGGVHAYWTLTEPTSDLEHVRRINQGIRDRLGGDNAVDPARILRLAGTLHRKQTPYRAVQLLRAAHDSEAAA